MSNLRTKPQGRQRVAGKGYEKRDASAPWIFGVVVFLLVAGLIMHFSLAGVLERLGRMPPPTDRWTGARLTPAAEQARGVPHLQIAPEVDLAKLRHAQETELNTYGWIDRTNGVVRIPISRAMDLLLQRGLPVRSQNKSATGPSSYELQQQRPNSPQPEIQENR